jgi:hypothetical protein
MAFDDGFSTRKRASKLCLALVCHQVHQRFLLPALRGADFHLAAALFRQQFLHHLAVFEFHRHVNLAGNVLLIHVNLQQQRREELRLVERPPGLPRRTRGGRQSARGAGGTDSAPPWAARRRRRRCRCRRPWRRPSSAAARSPRRWSADRAGRRLPRSACRRTPLPCARADRAPGRSGGLPETGARCGPRWRTHRRW